MQSRSFFRLQVVGGAQIRLIGLRAVPWTTPIIDDRQTHPDAPNRWSTRAGISLGSWRLPMPLPKSELGELWRAHPRRGHFKNKLHVSRCHAPVAGPFETQRRNSGLFPNVWMCARTATHVVTQATSTTLENPELPKFTRVAPPRCTNSRICPTMCVGWCPAPVRSSAAAEDGVAERARRAPAAGRLRIRSRARLRRKEPTAWGTAPGRRVCLWGVSAPARGVLTVSSTQGSRVASFEIWADIGALGSGVHEH